MSVISDVRRASSSKDRKIPGAATLDVSFESNVRSPIAKALAQPLASYYLILASTLLLLFLGVLMVLSSSSVFARANTGDSYYYLVRQGVFLLIGLPSAWWLSRRSEKFLKIVSWLGIIAAIAMLALIFVPGLGVERFGNRAWLNLGFVEIQPSELAKAALVLWSAAVLANKRKTLDRPMSLLIPMLPVQLIVLGLVVSQKDLGTAVIVAGIIFAMLFFVGAPMRVLLALAVPAIGLVTVLIVTSPHRLERVLGFLNGQGTSSDQPLNAIYALASGGWWGVGLGASRQKWGGLYNGALTDYVFAVLGEEMGLLGTLAVIGLFMVLGYAGFRVALRCTRPFPRLAAAGMTAWIMIQAIVNIGVAMKMFPVMGVPLPFISYGGSALLANLIAVGVLLACARCEPAAELALRDKGKAKRRVTSVVDTGRIR